MLSRGYPFAGVYRFHRPRNGLDEFVNRQGEAHGQFVDVLKMLIGSNNDVAVIVRPLVGTDEGCDDLIVVNDVGLN